MGYATTTIKIISIICNALLAIYSVVGIILVACKPDALPPDIVIPIYIYFGVLLVCAVVGGLGACRESKRLTITSALFLLSLLISLLISYFFVKTHHVTQYGIASVEEDWKHGTMDKLQNEHHCCGKDSPQDYILLGLPMPASCYDAANPSEPYQEGCSAKVQRYNDDCMLVFDWLTWPLAVLELCGIVLAVALAINFHNKQRREQF